MAATDTLASGGEDDTPRWQRIYWCIVLGATAALLPLAIGLVRQTDADLAGVARTRGMRRRCLPNPDGAAAQRRDDAI